MAESSGIKDVLRDVVGLCELQIELLAVDGKKALLKSFAAMVCVAIAMATMISAITILLAAFAWSLHSEFNLHLGFSLLIASLAAMVVGACLLLIAFKSIKVAVASMEESRIEFSQNLGWIRALLLSDHASSSLPASTYDNDAGVAVGFEPKVRTQRRV